MKFSEGGGLIRCHTPTSPHDRWSDMQRALIESWVLRLISMSVVMCYHRFKVHSREKRQEQMSNERFLSSLIWVDCLLLSCNPLRSLPIAQFFIYPDRSLSKLVDPVFVNVLRELCLPGGYSLELLEDQEYGRNL